MAEEGWTENEIAKLTIKEYLKSFVKSKEKIEALILGCTHYPLYEKIIKQELLDVEIINTGKIVAKMLKDQEIKNGSKNETKDKFYLTDTSSNFKEVANKILNKKIEINIKEL